VFLNELQEFKDAILIKLYGINMPSTACGRADLIYSKTEITATGKRLNKNITNYVDLTKEPLFFYPNAENSSMVRCIRHPITNPEKKWLIPIPNIKRNIPTGLFFRGRLLDKNPLPRENQFL
jgi:hypothetical protein